MTSLGSMMNCMSRTNRTNGILCLASPQTAQTVTEVASSQKLHVTKVKKRNAAIRLLQNCVKNEYRYLVAALGTNKLNCIFDGADSSPASSSLLSLAKSMGIIVIVYSHTASRTRSHSIACYNAGADIVCNTKEAFDEFITSREEELQMKKLKQQQEQQHSLSNVLSSIKQMTGAVTTDPVINDKEKINIFEHPSLMYRLERESAIKKVLKSGKTLSRRMINVRLELDKQLQNLRRPILSTENGSTNDIRCVFVSDTHNHHRFINLPEGDLLIHTGDACGNYGRKYDIAEHFRDYLKWLCDQSKKYQYVVFIAGNHDTYLDGLKYNDKWAKKLMRETLPSNIVYLENEHITLDFSSKNNGKGRSINIYGGPSTVSRLESMGKRYYSDGFERTNAERVHLWNNIPETVNGHSLDILLTHTPPTFDNLKDDLNHSSDRDCDHKSAKKTLKRLTRYGDPLLTKRINSMRKKPRFHCFGHDHHFFGVAQNETTTFLNGAQEEILRSDMEAVENVSETKGKKKLYHGIGCPLIFDC
jgi:predicted MPP superfamily phosphohydrolase